MVRKNPFLILTLVLAAAGLLFALACGLAAAGLIGGSPWLIWGAFLTGLTAAALGGRRLMTRLRRAALRLSGRMQSMLYGLGLLAALALGLVLRLYVIRELPIAPDSDFDTFFRLGRYLAEGTLLQEDGAYRDYVARFPHTLGFPLFVLKPAFSLWGTGVPVALHANLAYGLANILLTACIGRRLKGRACGLLAGTWMAIWPSHVLYAGLVVSEPSFTFYVLLSLYIAFPLLRQGEDSISRRYPVAAIFFYAVPGALLAIAGAIRPMALIVLAALLLTMALRREKAGTKGHEGSRQMPARRFLYALMLVCAYSLGNALITSRVQAEVELPLASGVNAFGYNLMVGVNAQSYGMWNEGDAIFFGEAYQKTGSADAAHRAAMEVALARIRENPLGMLRLAIAKYAIMWHGDDFGVDWALQFSRQQGTLTEAWALRLETLRVLGRFLYLCVLLLALLLLPQVFRRPRPEYVTLLLLFLGTAALHMALETQIRYHYTVLPVFILLASASVCEDRHAHSLLPVYPPTSGGQEKFHHSP